ncbi:hypothetical protein ACHAWF_002418 [Thalassiosira exigua]
MKLRQTHSILLPFITRPVCSDCASLPHALGQWIDEELQPIVRQQHTYFRDSLELKSKLSNLTLPPNASLFTYDAVSMYTNINTYDCIKPIVKFLCSAECKAKYPSVKTEVLIKALELVVRNNHMRFDDIIMLQLIGIAMGMSPALTIANLYVAIFESQKVLPWLEVCLLFSTTTSVFGSTTLTLPRTSSSGIASSALSTQGSSLENSPSKPIASTSWTS